MATFTTHKCDVCGADASPGFLKAKVPVAFETEQTEGRPCAPHLSTETLDMCSTCFQTLVERFPLRATGAQGHNTYRFKTDAASTV